MSDEQAVTEQERLEHQQFLKEVDAFIAEIDKEMCKLDQRYLVDLMLDNPFIVN